MIRSDEVLRAMHGEVVKRRADLAPDDGVTVLIGPRWSGTRIVAMRWMARQQRDGGSSGRQASWAVADFTSSTARNERTDLWLARYRSGDLRCLLILGRSLSQVEIDSLRAGVIPRVVGPRELRLSPDEIGELMRERGLTVDDERSHALHAATGGWLRMAVGAVDLLAERPALSEAEVGLSVRRRVMDRVAALDAATQTLLSCSPFWDPEMVQLAGLRDNADEASALLAETEMAGLLWSQVGDGDTRHVLEPVGAVLAGAETEGSGLPQHRRLAAELLKRGRLVDATSVALTRDDPATVWMVTQAATEAARWDLLVRIAARVSAYPATWFDQEHADFRILVTLAAVGRELPFEAWHDVQRSVRSRSTATATATATAENSLRSCLVLIGLYQATGDIQRAMDQARTAVQLSGGTGGARPSGVRVMALRSAAETFTVGGNVESAADAAARAVSAARLLGDPQALAAVHVTADLSRLLSGDLRDGHASQEGLEFAGHIPNVVGSSYVARACVEHERGDVPSARRLIAKARAALDETDLWWLAAQYDVVLTAHAGELAAAELIRQEINRRAERGRVISGPAVFASIDLAIEMLVGRPTEVLRRFEGRKLEFPSALVMKAAAQLALRQDDRALRLAQSLTGDPSFRVATLSRLVAAAAAGHAGRAELAHTHAQGAFELVQAVGLGTAVRYLTSSSQQLVRSELDAQQQAVFDEWCRWHGCISGAARPSVPLSPRERDLVVALGSDRSLGQIANDLGVTHNTVKTLTRRVYRKLGVTSRQNAVDLAQRLGLV